MLYDLGGAEFSWLRSARRGEWRWDGAGIKDFVDHHKKIALESEGIREPLNYLKWMDMIIFALAAVGRRDWRAKSRGSGAS